MKFDDLKKIDKVLGFIAFVLSIAILLNSIAEANLDLIDGRFALFYDEWITFDGVKNLLKPGNFSNFLQNIIDGIYLYGRGLMYFSAIFSYIPFGIFGDSGLIAANRIFQAVILLGTNALICFSFIRSKVVAVLCICLLSTLPSAVYYATMPKPEPIQLAFLTIFLLLASRNGFKFGYYWIFLGYSFGMKISVAPALLLFGLLAIANYNSNDFVHAKYYLNQDLVQWSKKIFKPILIVIGLHSILLGSILIGYLRAFCPYLCGYSLNKLEEYFSSSNPVLLQQIGFFSICVGCSLIFTSLFKYKVFKLLSRYFSNQKAWLYTAYFFSLGFILANPGILLKMPIGLMVWFRSTFFISNIADSREVNALSWAYYLPRYLGVEPLHFYLFSIFCTIFIIVSFLRAVEEKASKERDGVSKEYTPYILMSLGFVLIASIFIGVKRMWGMYLHIGLTFVTVPLFMISEKCFLLHTRVLKGFSVGLIFIMGVFSYFQFNRALGDFEKLSQRTKGISHTQRMSEFMYIKKYLESASEEIGRETRVLYDSRLYVPPSTKTYTVSSFWQFLIPWERNVDVIVSLKSNYPSELPESTTKAYRSAIQAIKKKEKYVLSEKDKCVNSVCYRKVHTISGEIDIFINTKLRGIMGSFAKNGW